MNVLKIAPVMSRSCSACSSVSSLSSSASASYLRACASSCSSKLATVVASAARIACDSRAFSSRARSTALLRASAGTLLPTLFDDSPDRWTLAGTAIIAGAGLYILHRERVRGKATVAATDPVAQ